MTEYSFVQVKKPTDWEIRIVILELEKFKASDSSILIQTYPEAEKDHEYLYRVK